MSEIVQNESMEIGNDLKKVETEDIVKPKLPVEENNEKTNGRVVSDTGNCYWYVFTFIIYNSSQQCRKYF